MRNLRNHKNVRTSESFLIPFEDICIISVDETGTENSWESFVRSDYETGIQSPIN